MIRPHKNWCLRSLHRRPFRISIHKRYADSFCTMESLGLNGLFPKTSSIRLFRIGPFLMPLRNYAAESGVIAEHYQIKH